ncbi:(+)-trans-carveol dehydrogenase (plasmid) [Rhodococcus jostii RHA1]|jgi:SDR family mycofactocin-dependent oxidoreductase|uniref:(+)-trans-carveol dehydrogenase n=2 Tax=Rhodococcus TaxID=1827 RepID=Q0RYG0_RHOJR|nr:MULTISPECIES: mycofactocin-coupled SDR family oxidoreductase [Rhodococcus]ABG99676.1 (+)-trans-carveol dehydrogenase [Rhodococcus jostii RHA1]EID76331.1 carveol dehydrogenase [Rhodococcus opacus RKJ300 = JCM 13270]QQZ18937.1 mycofactocin-coupled SDR family oxidoreductase [Rhodococcus sp. 21391]
MTGRLADKVAFITGAARGQGRSHAERLAEEGADIIAVDICGEVGRTTNFYPAATEEDLAETVRLVEKHGRRIIAYTADVRDFTALEAGLSSAVAELGRLDIVAANAGIFQFGVEVPDIPVDDWRDVIDVNLTGVFNTCKAAVPHIVDGRRGGSVVITSSDAGVKGFARFGHYVASKHGVIGLMRTLTMELAPHSIRVNVVAPTNCNTDMIQNDAVWKLFRPDRENPTFEEFAEASSTLLALPEPWVEPADVSNALLFLASDEARFITGVTLPVDGGSAAI